MTLAQVGNGSGFIYVTKAGGSPIVANFENTPSVWRQVQRYISAPLTDPTKEIDPIYGYRIYGDVGGVAGSIATANNLTRFFVNRASQATYFKNTVIIATDSIGLDRVTNNMVIVIDTEGGAATDNLNFVVIADPVDTDIITLVAESASRVVTVIHGTGNIYLANNANFISGGRQAQLVLRYSSAAPAGWYEVSRSNVLPTVANQRAVTVPTPISGADTTALTAGGGTITLTPGVDKGYQVLSGAATLVGSWVVQINPAPTVPYLDGDEMIVDYRSLLTQGANTVTIFGITLTATQALQGRVILLAKYNLTINTWYYRILYDATGVDITNKAYVDATFEPYLQLPAADNYILSSTVGGVRSWVPNTTPDTGWVDLLGFSFMPGGTRPQFRLIGKELKFRGTLVVPLSNDGGTTLIPYSSETSYLPQFYSAPYTGSGATGGVLINANGSIVFNQNAAVIPSSYFPDAVYSTPFVIATRRINSDTVGNEIAYTATVIIILGTDGKLTIGTLYDFENLSGTNVGHSPLRFLNSNVVAGDYALNLRTVNTSDTLFGITANTPLPYDIAQQTFKHSVTFDAALPQNLGGFNVNISGLRACLA